MINDVCIYINYGYLFIINQIKDIHYLDLNYLLNFVDKNSNL